MAKTLGAAVVGTGFGFLTHVRALREAGIEVVAIVGRDPSKTADRARRGGIAHAVTNFDEALELPGVDLVTVATPPHTHADIVIRACEAGKHVMCEKPFAANVEEAERMLDAADRAGVVHALGTEFRYASGQALAGRAIDDGAIGSPRLATFMLMIDGLADPRSEVPSWWSDAGQGGGWLGAYASHVIDQSRTMLGEWTGLSASLTQIVDREWTAEDSYTIHFRTDRGCNGVLQSSSSAYGPFVMMSRVSGSKGTVSFVGDTVTLSDASGSRDLEMPVELRNPDPDPPDPELIVTAYDNFHALGLDLGPFAKLFAAMRDTIEGKTAQGAPLASFEDGVALQRILDAVYRSSQGGTWETL